MADKYVAYVGSYTRGVSKGIYIVDVDPEKLSFVVRDVYALNNPSFVTLSKDEKYLYTTCDAGVAAFKIEKDGSLKLLNMKYVNGLRPCYLSVDSKNEYMICAGYHDGKLTLLKLEEDGSVGDVTDEVYMKGLGNVTGRNYRCHVNCALFTPDEEYILAVDVGMDQVKVYQFDKEHGKMHLHDILRCELESGPKHMIFSSDGKYAYMTHENTNYVTQYEYSAGKTLFKKMATISTLPENYDGYSTAVTLKLTPDNKHLLATNSGHNSVAIYDIDDKTKALTVNCILPVSGNYPRGLQIMPNGKSFVSVNQESDSLTCFNIIYDKHYIVMKGKPVYIPNPASICMKKL